jgi:hypothetical protein
MKYNIIVVLFPFAFIFFGLESSAQVKAKQFLVINGQPNAEIIIDENPKRAAKFAAKELQHYIKQISGANLPIYPSSSKVDNKSIDYNKRYSNKIYVGESQHTKNLLISTDELDWGAYKVISGNNHLILIGKDTEFTPQGIWAKSRADWFGNTEGEWDNFIDHAGWENAVGAKMWNRYNSELDLWAYDQKGSLNAVYGFLRHLGVRWFMPGELGEYIPKLKDIKLTDINEVVKPHFKIRKASFMRFGNGSSILPDVLWSLRLGMNYPYGYDIYHGLKHITSSDKIRKEHPEYYALYNGKRANDGKTPEPCLSSEGLFEEHLKFLRTMFDTYDLPAFQVSPDDGFTKICECDKCIGKDTPERGSNGLLSDYVWEYINNIAIEIEKTHPGKYIIGSAYSTYWKPPTTIEKLNPNLIVRMVNARRRYEKPEEDARKLNFTKEERLEYVKEWSEKSENKIINLMNFGGASNTPNIFGEDINAIQNYALGEDMWVAHDRGGLAMPGFNHLNYYLSARMWWNPDINVDDLLDEYYKLYYGPVAEEMKEFINHFEVNQRDFGSADKLDTLKKGLDLFYKAKNKVDKETIYGKRIISFEEGIEKYKLRYEQLKIDRTDAPTIRANASLKRVNEIKFDGKLDELFWRNLRGSLKDNITGQDPVYPTRFKVGLQKKYIYIGISSQHEPGRKMNVSTEKNDDPVIWDGEYIDILIETPVNSYYQISINPAGAITDFDRGNSGFWGLRWESNIELANNFDAENGIWTIEARIPVTSSDQDPLHEIIGLPPRENLPWFINVCRKRIGKDKVEYSAFSPTGTNSFLVNTKFGRLSFRK